MWWVVLVYTEDFVSTLCQLEQRSAAHGSKSQQDGVIVFSHLCAHHNGLDIYSLDIYGLDIKTA